MSTLEQGTRIERGDRIILGAGFVLDQDDDGVTILNVSATGGSTAWADITGKPTTLTGYGITDAVNLDRLGAASTTGVLDWNDASNARPGTGVTLLYGDATNGPGSHSYFHTFSLEYAVTKDGTGQLTQFAIPYANSMSPGMYMRGRYQGSWTSWARFWTSQNDGAGSGLDADLLDGQQGSYYLDWTNTTNKPVYATRWPTASEVGLSRFVNSPVQGNSGPYGSVRITGSEGSYAGIQFADAAVTLMVYNASGVLRQGFYRYTSAPTVGWEWYFENGVLTVGTVPWARLSGINQTLNTTDSPVFANLIVPGVGRIGVGTTNPSRPITIAGSATQDPWISFSGGNMTKEFLIGGNALGFSIYDQGAGAYRFTINSAGCVGINTIPNNGYRLYVVGDSLISGNLYANELIDALNTGYYVIPRGTSNLYTVQITNSLSVVGAGGVSISNNAGNLSFGATTRQMVNLYSTLYGIGVQSSTTYFRTGGGFAWFKAGSHSDTQNDPGPAANGYPTGEVLALLNVAGQLSANRFYSLGSSLYYLEPKGTSVLNTITLYDRVNSSGPTPLSMDIAAGGGHYPYIEWKYGGTRGAYMGWGTPGSQLDLTLENGNSFKINGGAVYITGGGLTVAQGLAVTGDSSVTGNFHVNSGELYIGAGQVRPIVISTGSPVGVSSYPVGTLFIQY